MFIKKLLQVESFSLEKWERLELGILMAKNYNNDSLGHTDSIHKLLMNMNY
jgi:hypothetical protein